MRRENGNPAPEGQRDCCETDDSLICRSKRDCVTDPPETREVFSEKTESGMTASPYVDILEHSLSRREQIYKIIVNAIKLGTSL